MFDVGFSELIVIGIVALIVIGPERLPKVARTAGHLFGRLQRYVNDVKADINREMQLDELRKLQADMQESARSLENNLNKEIQTVGQAVEQATQSATQVPQAPSSGESAKVLAGEIVQPAPSTDSVPSGEVAAGGHSVPKA
jgi:sec-independent protein translocase protein TatB